jgi:hypothetical protein
MKTKVVAFPFASIFFEIIEMIVKFRYLVFKFTLLIYTLQNNKLRAPNFTWNFNKGAAGWAVKSYDWTLEMDIIVQCLVLCIGNNLIRTEEK